MGDAFRQVDSFTLYPVSIRLRRSRILNALLVIVYATAVLVFVCAAHSVLFSLAVLPVSFVLYRWEQRRLQMLDGCRLVLDKQGTINLVRPGENDAQQLAGALCADDCVDFGWALWLCWPLIAHDAPAKQRNFLSRMFRRRYHALMLLPDQMMRADWRRLRLWLRYADRRSGRV